MITNPRKDYLDHGYVGYVDHMGSDLSFTKAARASFAKEVDEWSDKEQKLLEFLIRQKHFSVFRHAAVTFQIKAPLMVARQHWKYVVASVHTDDQSGWNESSRRYVTMEPEFYIPARGEWRSAPENKKQGSGPTLQAVSDREWLEINQLAANEEVPRNDPKSYGNYWTDAMTSDFNFALAMYNDAMESGVCAEQARMFLPAYAMYVSYQWTISVAGLMHFFTERVDPHAQHEIRLLAELVYGITAELYPAAMSAFALCDDRLVV